ncbi:hypothetical protein [Maribacter dokdonensis]|uniref:hypothetical protein n=1 Tax=Maribacter dokdonensis TaxID=320912 RepID=UPI001C08C395|nr:hypothetical protein [Maribacter dokdonensis]MBU2901549.1 hypothetical protein [Maribacter dokdonensis]
MSIIIETTKETFASKKKAVVELKNLTKNLCDFSVEKFHSYRCNGIKKSLNTDFNKLGNYTENGLEKLRHFRQTAPEKLKMLSSEIPKNKDELVDKLTSGAMSILIFYMSAGGVDLEGGIPDLDLQVGVGYHRHWMSHSIVSGLIFEFASRGIFNAYGEIHKNLPSKHHRFWDTSKKFIEKNKEIAIGSMWAGIGAHLIKDSALIAGGFKPYVGVPIEMPTGVHQGLFMANGLASTIFGASLVKNSNSFKATNESVIYVKPTPVNFQKDSVIHIEPSPVKLKVMFRNNDTDAIRILLKEIGEATFNHFLDNKKVKNRPKSMKGFYLESIDNKILLCYEYPSKTTLKIMDVKNYSTVPKNNWALTKINNIKLDI